MDEFGPTPLHCAAGISYRRLDYWCRTGIVSPEIDAGTGSGLRRRFSRADACTIAVTAIMLRAGLHLEVARLHAPTFGRAVAAAPNPAAVVFIVAGRTGWMCDTTGGVREALAQAGAAPTTIIPAAEVVDILERAEHLERQMIEREAEARGGGWRG